MFILFILVLFSFGVIYSIRMIFSEYLMNERIGINKKVELFE